MLFKASLATVIALYLIGLYCLAAKRNMIRLMIGIGILGNAVNLNFMSISAFMSPGTFDPFAHLIVIIVIVIETVTMAVGLTMVIHAYRHYGTLDVRELRRLRW